MGGPPDGRPESRFPRAAGFAVAWAGIVVAAAAFAARFVPITNHAVLALAAFSPYLALAAGVSVGILLLLGRRRTAAGALALAAVTLAVQVPKFAGPEAAAASGVAVRLLTVNLAEGGAEPVALAAVMRERADVVLFQEITPELVRSLTRTGVGSAFPDQKTAARPGAAGIAIWSRYPVEQSTRIPEYPLGMITADLRVPGVADAATVAAVHIAGPWPQPIAQWRQDIAQLRQTLSDMAGRAGSRPVIVGGDFNATTDMAPFRRALPAGMGDAADQAGAGLIRTFPAGSRLPPLIAIDHVLTYNSQAISAQSVQIPGTDHMGLLTTLLLPERPAGRLGGHS